MQLPHEQGKNQDIEVDVVLPLFVSCGHLFPASFIIEFSLFFFFLSSNSFIFFSNQ